MAHTKRRFLDYEPTPFYFLNDDIDREELIKQLDFMQEHTIKSFFLHVREGITGQAWGTNLFFSHVRFIVEEAKNRGINVWLYDEDSYPSGQCGGQIVIDRPELQARSLKIIKKQAKKGEIVREVLGRVRGLIAYAVTKVNGKEKVRKIADCFGTVRRNWFRTKWYSPYFDDFMGEVRYPHERATTYYAEVMFEAEMKEDCDLYIAYLAPTISGTKFFQYADCLNKQTTEEYTKRILEKYKRSVGDYFGKEIQGMFIDEPTLGGDLAFTGELYSYIKDNYKLELFDHLYKLSSDYEGDKGEFRKVYFRAVGELFIKNFLTPVKEWLKNNKLKLVGHFGGEENLTFQAKGQNIYRQSMIMDIPGFDILTTNLGDIDHPSLLLGANLVCSANKHQGRDQVLSECFGCTPFNFGYDGQKRTADWLFSLGINWLVPHAFHYGYSAYQRGDAGKSFFFQDPQFNEYERFAEYAGRVCKILSRYQRDNEVLLIYPDGALAEETSTGTGTHKIHELTKRTMTAVKNLYARHVQWDVADTKAVLDATVKEGKLLIGTASYSKVIIVSGGNKEKTIYEFLKKKGVDCAVFDGENLSVIPEGIKTTGKTERIQIYKKHNGKEQLLFLFNNSFKYEKFKLEVSGDGYIYDAEEDLSYSLATVDGFVEIALQPFDSKIIVVGTPYVKPAFEYVVEKIEKKFDPDYYYRMQLHYEPEGCRKAICCFNLKATVNGKEKDYGEVEKGALREYIGANDNMWRGKLFAIPNFDVAKRQENFPCSANYSVKVTVTDKTDYLLFDKHTVIGDYELYVNGNRVAPARFVKTRVYDASNYVVCPEWKLGENLIEIKFLKATEFDGVCGELYLMKK